MQAFTQSTVSPDIEDAAESTKCNKTKLEDLYVNLPLTGERGRFTFRSGECLGRNEAGRNVTE